MSDQTSAKNETPPVAERRSADDRKGTLLLPVLCAILLLLSYLLSYGLARYLYKNGYVSKDVIVDLETSIYVPLVVIKQNGWFGDVMWKYCQIWEN